MNAIEIRRIQPSDSLDDLTTMLHRAFGPLGRLGLSCTCVDQPVETTRRRIAAGDCYVAVVAHTVVGTITLQDADRHSPVYCYANPAVASLHQFGVDPLYQSAGVGKALLDAAVAWARRRGYTELALDTPEAATHLRAYYARHGFQLVEVVQLPTKSYRSAILRKTVDEVGYMQGNWQWAARHPMELALVARSRQSRFRPTTCP